MTEATAPSEENFVEVSSRPVMTMRQLTEYLQVTEQAIFNWIKRSVNPFPVGYAGGVPRFFVDEVRDWMKDEADRRISANANKRNLRRNNKSQAR